MRTAWIDATLSALLGFVAALLAVAARLRGRLRSTQDACTLRPSFGGWAVLPELPDGSSSRLLVDDGIDDATRIELAKAWQELALSAHRALAASTHRALDLVTLCAPPELVVAAHEGALVEVRRAKLCFSVARAIGGSIAPPGQDGAPRRALPGLRPVALAMLATEVVLEVALTRGLAARIDAKLARRTTDRAIRAVLEEIASGEGRHVRHAWAIIEWCLSEGGAPVEHALRALVGRLPSLVPIVGDRSQEASDGGWERWGIAGSALEGQEHARVVEAIERKLTALAGTDAASERLMAT